MFHVGRQIVKGQADQFIKFQNHRIVVKLARNLIKLYFDMISVAVHV